MAVIKTENLTYVYGEGTPFRKTAVDNVNIEINDGEMVGIIGHTGSGKSTLIQRSFEAHERKRLYRRRKAVGR